MKGKWVKSFIVALAIVFAVGFSAEYVGAKGASSFGGGGGRSSGFSSGGGRSSRFSSGGGVKASSPSPTGFSSKGTPSAQPAQPTQSGGFSSKSTGAATTQDAGKGSSFSTEVGKGAASAHQQKPQTGTYDRHSSASSSSNRYYGGGTRTRVVVEHRYTVAPSGWTPTYVYWGGYHPVAQYVNLIYQIEMLKTISDMQQRQALMAQIQQDPNYAKWKAENSQLANENAELKKQLAEIDATPVSYDDQEPAKPVKKGSNFWWWVFGIAALGGFGYIGYRLIKIN